MMKVAKTLLIVTLSVHAVSAFGLHTAASNAVKSMNKLKPPPVPQSPFQKKSMVQPVDIHGNRLSSIVSKVL
jgi:energy-converting hydrogenase Eha subunit F